MLNIVIPMAGRGSRFAVVGYSVPKPLIPVHGRPMIQLVIENLTPSRAHRFIFICQSEHDRLYGLTEKLTQWAPGAEVVLIDGITEGAACTVLAAEQFINNHDGLMIANSDQYVEVEIDQYLSSQDENGAEGLIMTMAASDPKWSYVALDEGGFATRVVEKQPISPHATVGIYNFKRGSDFVAAARQMISADERTNGEFYVAPVYNNLIGRGGKISIFDVGREGAGMHGLGIPEDLEAFLKNPVSTKALEKIREDN